jgi:hypothetical protein
VTVSIFFMLQRSKFSYVILKRFSSVAIVILECYIGVSFMLHSHTQSCLMLLKLYWDVTGSQCSCFKSLFVIAMFLGRDRWGIRLTCWVEWCGRVNARPCAM